MQSLPKVGIIGCGWLGKSLALNLIEQGIAVVGTSRGVDKCEQLRRTGIDAFPFDLEWMDEQPFSVQCQHAMSALAACDVWIVNIAPGRKSIEPQRFAGRMKHLMKQALDISIAQVIFVSTTSVYGDSHFISITEVAESFDVNPETGSAKAHCQIEAYLRKNLPHQHCILRLAGLVDSERHPVTSLCRKQHIGQPLKPVNLVHKLDVIAAINNIIKRNITDKTLHLSAIDHPSRREYYTWAADKKRLPIPNFAPIASDSLAQGKVIDPTVTLSTLGLSLKFPSPYDML